MDEATAIEQHFRDLLLPRNRGLIAVVELTNEVKIKRAFRGDRAACRPDARGLVACLANQPFLEVNLGDGAITLHIGYPSQLAIWDPRDNVYNPGYGTITSFSKKPKLRAAQIKQLAVARVVNGKSVRFELCAPDSLGKAEFYAQTTITRIKYMVSNRGYYGNMPKKKDVDFPDLLETAAVEYNMKVLAKLRR